MAAELGLVVQPAQAHPLELAVQGAGDRLPQRGLAHARRADEAEDRRLGLRVELQHGQVLEDPLLDLLQVVVVLVEHLLGPFQVQDVVGAPSPGELEDQLEIGPGDLVIGRGGGQPLQPCQLALGLLAHLVGQVGLVEAAAQLLGLLALGVLLAQLVLDGPELLAEHVVALLLAHLGLGLAGDLLPQLEHLQLVGQVAVEQPEGLEPRGRLEQGLLPRARRG